MVDQCSVLTLSLLSISSIGMDELCEALASYT